MKLRIGRSLLALAAASTVLYLGWSALVRPSNDREWRTEEAVLPYATVEGNRVTFHNIRNFDYRSSSDFTPAYYDKTYDLDQLDSADLYAVYWMGPHIAHIFISFGFGDDHLAVSIEARKEKGEGYSSVKGFFRQYELYYVVADERDVVRVRSNYRNDPVEDVYLYPLKGSKENIRRVFLDYVERINSLREHPRFYNTLTTNCTTAIWSSTRVNQDHLPLSWKILASGHVPEYLYERGLIDTSAPFETIRERAHINARARAADQDPDFSRRIREPAIAP